MVESILFFLLIFFAVIGITEVFYILNMFFYYPKTRTTTYSLIVLRKHDALNQLNFLCKKIKWQGDAFATGIIAITDDIDNDELSRCKDFICNKNIMLYTTYEFLKNGLLQGELSNGNR